jgi:molybdenum cofactor biosynthesis enzyme MoaA
LRPCLLEEKELDLKGALRKGVSDGFLGYLFQEVIRLKLRKSVLPLTGLNAIPRDLPMVSVGG